VEKIRIGDVIAMLALVIVVLIGVIVAAQLYTVANNMDLGVQGNATRTQLFNNTWTGLTLASVGIIIAAAVGILAMVMTSLSPAGVGGGVAG
jgi:ABC-type Fe3+ transport system permease subunit